MIKTHEKSLADCAPGAEGAVTALEGDRALRLRLMELGFCPEATVRVVRRAPFGCPMEVEVEGARFSVRADVARSVRLRHG